MMVIAVERPEEGRIKGAHARVGNIVGHYTSIPKQKK